MAVRVISKVWEGYPGGGSELLALLALADWSDDDGRCWPSIASVSKKTRLERRQAQRVIHRLIDAGYVVVTGNETGGAPGSTRQYRIVLSKLTGVSHDTPTGVAKDTGVLRDTGVTGDADGCHPRRETGVSHDTQTVSEPSVHVNTREQARSDSSASSKTKKPDTTLAKFIEACKTAGEKPIPDDDPVFEYAEKVGIDHDMLACAWVEFKSRYLPTTKRQKDWRAHFRNAVRCNWYKLWYIKEGEAARWTTAGEQARREAA
jgi:hypothetical protein